MSKVGVVRSCVVSVKGVEKYRPLVKKAVDRFLEFVDLYYKLGFVKEINLSVSFKEGEKTNE